MLKHILFVFIMILGGYYFLNSRPVEHGPGVVAPNEPVQQRAYGIKAIDYEGLKLSPFAKIDIEARVLSKKRYFEDKEAEFAPYDFVIGWGPMSDERNLDQILIKQTERSFYWEMIEPPISISEMRQHSANIRLIPSDTQMSDQIGNIRIGEVIKVKGYLVNVASKDGWSVESSSTRKDTGKKASEIIWIKELRVL